jgi:hypothetical protein
MAWQYWRFTLYKEMAYNVKFKNDIGPYTLEDSFE